MSISTRDRQPFQYTLTQNHPDGPNIINLTQIKEEKDIGVIIDERLTFKSHMTQKVNKANCIMGIIRRTFDHLDKDTFLLAYKALVRPHLEYGNAIWHPYKKTDIILVENVQRRATKLLPGMSKLSYEERLKTLGLPTLQYRRLRGDMIETFKILHNKYDQQVTQDFLPIRDQSQSTETRGHHLRINHQYSRLKLRQNSFCLRIAKLWNDLPEQVVTSQSVRSFEKRLDKAWATKIVKYNFNANSSESTNPTLTELTYDEDLATED